MADDKREAASETGRLWAPWRSAYVEQAGKGTAEGCLFCRCAAEQGRERDNLVLMRGQGGIVMLNRFPYNTGHVMVAPLLHVADPAALGEAEAAALARLLVAALRAVRAAYRPDGVNLGMNLGAAAGAGIADHCHWHVVPRWTGDTNFMPAIGATKVLSESLDASFDRLRPHLRDAGAGAEGR